MYSIIYQLCICCFYICNWMISSIFVILMIWIMNRKEGQMNDMLQTLVPWPSLITGFNFTPTEGAVVLNWENNLTSSCAASLAFFFMFIFLLCRWIICFLWCTFTWVFFFFFAAEMDTCIIERTFNQKGYILLPACHFFGVLLLNVRNWGTLVRKLPHWHIHCPDRNRGIKKRLKV